MDTHSELREFLMTRRARLTPEQAGLPLFGGRRRVDGLRREEVALIAGISVEYYVRLERGNAAGVSDAVLDGISRALQLDDAEHAHLLDLVRASAATVGAGRRRPAKAGQVSASVQQMIDAMKDVAVLVQNGRGDVITANPLGRALYSVLYDQPANPNFGRFVFLDPRSHDFYLDWDDAAAQTVALLRSEAGRAPNDRSLSNLVGELSTRSDVFRTLWAAHNVREHRTGTKRLHHPDVRDLTLSYEGLQITSAPGLLMLPYSAPPGTDSHDKLQLLAALNAPTHSAQQPSAP
ncbi:helix-turn-helix transcriptional regulator [Microbacterium sp. NM3R9]|uniref:helix-turn-helix domain-containing protein n=1 Tax=Microbacterium thalli TaxID=3027921 RepID=UPI0023669780|nr:helix-turn-helix transcriptional regulator [Microbacterium thalli]MDN8548009.1 helix-turn-helix transcriptional regulator [Microbacterium thalli]